MTSWGVLLDVVALLSAALVALLLFSLGLEFSPTRLRSFGKHVLWGAVLQVVVTFAVFALLAGALGLGTREALVVGGMLALSSTACVLRILLDHGELDGPHGRHSVAILLVQDIAVVPLAVLITVISGDKSAPAIAWDVAKLLVLAAGFVAGLYIILNTVATRLLGRFMHPSTRELALLLAVVIGLGSTWAAHSLNISPALGAFLAGMFLGTSPFATQVRADVASLRVILLTLFFSSAGMIADPLWLLSHLPLVILTAVVAILVKTIIVTVILRSLGETVAAACATGLCIGQIGEFAFVLGSIAVGNGVLTQFTYLLVVCSAIVSLFLTPYLIPVAPQAGLWLEYLLHRNVGSPARRVRESHAHPEVVIIGFGPAGQRVADAFKDLGRKLVVIDMNTQAVTEAEERGFDGEIGDARQIEVLEHLGLDKLRLVVITVPIRSAALTIVDHVRELAPNAKIIVRARYERHRPLFETAGVDIVVGDEIAVGEELYLAAQAA